MIEETVKIPFTCNLDCITQCELLAHVRDGEILRIDVPDRPDTDEQPRLIPCARGRAHRRLQNVPERLTSPLKRTGPRGSGQFKKISWEEALDETAKRMKQIKEEYGTQAVLLGQGPGASGSRGLSGGGAARTFFSFWGDVTQITGNMSTHNINSAAWWMYGGVFPSADYVTLLESKLIILWGFNPAVTRMGTNSEYFIARARDRGAKVILIDPRCTPSAVLADEWLPIRPGTDTALAAAMAYIMETEGLADQEFLKTHSKGYDLYRNYITGQDDGIPRTPEWAEDITGLPADTIRNLAREFSSVSPAAILPGWGPQRTLTGEQFARAMIVLACMGGTIGIPGGGIASQAEGGGTAMKVLSLPSGPYTNTRSLTAPLWAQELQEQEFDPPIKMAYIAGSNLINRSPNTVQNAEVLSALDFIVVNEQFMTPTAGLADIVFPVCTILEKPEIVTDRNQSFQLYYSHAAANAPEDVCTDYAVFSQLAERLDFPDEYTQGRSETEWIQHMVSEDDIDFDVLDKDGLIRIHRNPIIPMAEFRQDPAANPLPTESGLIEIASPDTARFDLPLIPSYIPIEKPADYPLHLLTNHNRKKCNSCLHANPWLQAIDQHAVWINAEDARERDIEPDGLVEVFNDNGTIIIPAKVTQRIRPGTVCVPYGTWYDPDDTGRDRGGSANTLTSWNVSPTGGAATHSDFVEIKRHDE